MRTYLPFETLDEIVIINFLNDENLLEYLYLTEKTREKISELICYNIDFEMEYIIYNSIILPISGISNVDKIGKKGLKKLQGEKRIEKFS